VITVAAVADVHFDSTVRGSLRPGLEELVEDADVLLLPGDLTRLGTVQEASALAEELEGLTVPMYAVLGNHDLHAGHQLGIATVMARAGVVVLEGDGCTLDVNGTSVGIVGAKGFGGGFAGASGSDFGEDEMKAFMRHTKQVAARVRNALVALATDVRIAMLHYSPIAGTLEGERREIYPFLGSHLLADAIDEAGADLVVHGHAHGGIEEGTTRGGIAVRNVAQPVIRRPAARYVLDGGKVLTDS